MSIDLKKYQKDVLKDLQTYLHNLLTEKNIVRAYNKLWNDKDVEVGGVIKAYQTNIPSVPDVCLKVPTAGGKTLLACASIKPIFEVLTECSVKVVVWLVPSDSILEQTLKNLKNLQHDYRTYINNDFQGKVEVYSKQELLQGQNFSPATISNQLSICVLSYDSIRTSNQEGRKVYQQNGALCSFRDNCLYDGYHIECKANEEYPNLMAVLRSLEPVIVIDESHNATSELSVQMIKEFNPSFVLNLTATPKENSNIISIVDAYKLKKENMVKLPVIVSNEKSPAAVYSAAIKMQKFLENEAKKEQELTGEYIRPIVLLQAESRAAENRETFDKIKQNLLAAGIPEEQIAIKTADINEIKNIDLKSEDCEIRYIITVNALKEGWDCPFAYILASVANRNSAVDVEQILGRILRLPNVKAKRNKHLNESFVFTSSKDFDATITNIVKGLNKAGFTEKDYRVAAPAEVQPHGEQQELFLFSEEQENSSSGVSDESDIPESKFEAKAEDILNELENFNDESMDSDEQLARIITNADNQQASYENTVAEAPECNTNVPTMLVHDNDIVKVKDSFNNDLKTIALLPKLYFVTDGNVDSLTEEDLVTKEGLTEDYQLSQENSQIDYAELNYEIFAVDIEEGADVPTRCRISSREQKIYKEFWMQLPEQSKKSSLMRRTVDYFNGKYNILGYQEIKSYIERIIAGMDVQRLEDFANNYLVYLDKIEDKIESFLTIYRSNRMKRLLDSQEIVVKFDFSLAEECVVKNNTSDIAKMLYSGESKKMNYLEKPFIERIAGLENVKWWHRNGSNTFIPNTYHMNGFINHCPDFIILTKQGHLICAETKGEQYRETKSELDKAMLGSLIQAYGNNNKFHYYMIFKNPPDCSGCISEEDFFRNIERW